MKRLICLFLIAVAVNVMSCSKDSEDELKLSKDEAKTIIQKEMGYPKPVGDLSMGTRDEEVDLIIKKLIDAGYVKPDWEEQKNVYGIKGLRTHVYLPTEKGKAHIEKIRMIYRGNALQSSAFLGSVAVVDLQDIKEIFIDRTNGIATVQYVVDAKPIEPMYAMLCQGGVDCKDILKREPREIRLKKDDKVWRKENSSPTE
jgi:DNA-binding PadR family transcriptional regulator